MRKLNAVLGVVALVGAVLNTVCGLACEPFSLPWLWWTAAATVQACWAGSCLGGAICGDE
jgi:hypothetical protein